MMSDIFRSVITMSISGSIVALILFVLKPALKNRLSKQVQYYLWLIVIVQLLLPFGWELRLTHSGLDQEIVHQPSQIVTIRDTVDSFILNRKEEVERVSQANRQTNMITANETNIQSPISLTSIIYADIIWPVGAAISILWCILTYLIFTHRIKKTMEDTGIKTKLPVFKSSFAQTPMIIGLFKPVIVLPEKQFQRTQLGFIIAHELEHNKRKDILIKWLATIALCIHWFNPLAYFIRREINRACELSCDEAVIRDMDNAGKQGYGDTLISVVAESRYPAGVVSTTMCEDKKTLKERLVSIMKYKKQSKFLIVVSVMLVAVVAACAFALGAKNGPQTQAPTDISPPITEAVNSNKRSPSAKSIKELIDKNLDIIASPQKVSNIFAYIRSHQAEYDEIIALGQNALPHLYSIWQGDNGLKGAVCWEAMLHIQPDLNIKSAVSDGKYNNYRIETYGIDFENPISGLYPAKEIRLIDTNTGDVLWSMTPGYLKTAFLWSPDSRYVAISYMARTYAETIVLDTNTMTLVPLPGINEIAERIDNKLVPRENRPDPYIWLYKWTYNQSPKLQMTFEWTAENDKQIVGGFDYDMFSGEISKLYADFAPEPKPLDFGKPDSLEIKYNYFDYFQENYKPFTTKDEKTISLLTEMLQNSVVRNKLEYDDISRPNNPTAVITFKSGGEDQEINLKLNIDTLYLKSCFELDGVYYSPSYDAARFIQNLEEFRPQNMDIEKTTTELFNSFGLNPGFQISSIEVKLPDNLLYKGNEFPLKLYWRQNLELSKDIGLDFEGYLGKSLTADKYYLINPLPEAFKPRTDTYAVVLKDGGKIVGAYLCDVRNELACSLNLSTFEDITGQSFDTWYAANGYDMKDQVNINNAKLTPEEVVAKYYESLNRGDNSYFQYLSIGRLMGYLTQMTEHFESPTMETNINSVKLLSIERSKEPANDNEMIFDISIDMQVKQEITDPSGIQNITIWLVKEGDIGWKVVGAGH